MKTVIDMAREASNTPIDHHATPDLFGISQIERFAELIRADEREACARVADPTEDHRERPQDYIGQFDGVELLDFVAAAIRARTTP